MTEDSKKYKIYWDINQNTPIIVNTELGAENNHLNIKYLSTDLRPVFLEELFLISTLVPDLPKDIFFKSAWASQRAYFVGGEKIEVSLKKELLKIKDLNSLRNSIKNFQPTSEMLKSELHHIKNFTKANKDHLNFLLKSNQEDNEGYPIGAEPFIEQQVTKFKNRTLVVSFSGGKDSIVVSHLVRKALNNQGIIHIFGDTTLEQPATYQFIDEFMAENENTPFFIEKMKNQISWICVNK